MINTVETIKAVALNGDDIIDRLTLEVYAFIDTASTLCNCPDCAQKKDILLETAALSWVMGLDAYHAYMAMRDVYYLDHDPKEAVFSQEM